MFGSSRSRRRRVITSALAVFQALVLAASLVAPAATLGVDPTPDPSAPVATPAPDPTPDPSAPDPTPEVTPDSAPGATPEPAPEPTAAPDPTAEPTAAPVATPTIFSDKDDYAPGELVTLIGADWQPGESVHIFVNDDWGSTWARSVVVIADAAGAITDQFNLPGWFVATYSVVGTGEASGVATTTFTDAKLTVKRGPSGNPPNLVFTFTYQRGFSGADCAGTGGTTSTGVVNGDDGTDLTGLGNAAYVKITAPATPTSPAGYTFRNWTAEGNAPTLGFPKTPLSICVRNTSGSNEDVYRANYELAAVATSVGSITASASTYGGSTNLSATVSPAGAPGNVAFFVAGTLTPAAGAVTYNSATGVATLVGYAHGLNASASPYSVKAVFSSTSSGYTSSDSTNSSALIIDKAATVTTVNCPASVTYTGSAQTPCTATVTGPGLGQLLTVTYADNTEAGLATANASYAESANHLGSSGSKTFDISKADATCSVSGYSGVYDGDPHGASGSCTGVKGEDLSADLDLGASFTDVPGGTANWTFTDSTGNYTDQGGSVGIVIEKAPSATVLAFEAGPYFFRATAFTATAVVTGAGGLNQSLAVVYSGDCTNVTVADGCTASAAYGGDANHTSSSDSTSITIIKANTTTVVVSSQNPSLLGQAVTFTATVSPVAPGAGTQTGTVTFKDNATVLGSGTLNASGVATFTTSTLAIGGHPIIAAYSGDGSFNPSTSPTLGQVVNYRFDGFLQPINDTAHSQICSSPCPVSVFKAGSTVPVKFELKAADGSIVQAASLPLWIEPVKGGPITAAIDEGVYTDLPTTGSTYRVSGQQYIYNWSTKGLKAGFYYRIGVKLEDGQMYYVYIGLK